MPALKLKMSLQLPLPMQVRDQKAFLTDLVRKHPAPHLGGRNDTVKGPKRIGICRQTYDRAGSLHLAHLHSSLQLV